MESPDVDIAAMSKSSAPRQDKAVRVASGQSARRCSDACDRRGVAFRVSCSAWGKSRDRTSRMSTITGAWSLGTSSERREDVTQGSFARRILQGLPGMPQHRELPRVLRTRFQRLRLRAIPINPKP